ncbi:MAG: type II restriction endonuclease [Rhodobacteraceae bacterium]|nr:type II restriction endonuclease [Paracoccaceae bacterium]
MKRGALRDCFTGVSVKRLSAVDADPRRSNQHEVGTTADMRAGFLGAAHRQRFDVRFLRLGDDVGDRVTDEGSATHYDARRAQPARNPEWRLYYPTNPVTEAMRAGDTLFLAMDRKASLWFVVAPEGSTAERQLCWLFSVSSPEKHQRFVTRDITDDAPELGFAARFILDKLGMEPGDPEADRLDGIIRPLGGILPSTAEFSALARRSSPDVSPGDDPDGALVTWLDWEESLFRRLERQVVAARLEQGFMMAGSADVDGFIAFSLSVQNRRKARMGFSLEHHLAAILDVWKIAYERQAVTENRYRPDFLFPSAAAYRAAAADDPGLGMLAAKSSCKERWRQVLAEADKISHKHLLTLEPGISTPQTDQMQASGLQLVVPQPIQDSYTDIQQTWLLTLADFVIEMTKRQATDIADEP